MSAERGEDEGGLAEVGLAGEGLHLGGGEAARVGEDGEGVAFEGTLGEDVDLGVVEGCAAERCCGRRVWAFDMEVPRTYVFK
jgi:hypothetical protein